ncbi:glucose-6-phosphate exchanger SLC37A2-like isoform X2 [Ruditapes philippinarum]|uniref:glucose-6-phosphate exchanger SLC37A2-like isoform X2 n=1 Tax=Ruditapes philippinarum TaxID=129788 RepID=UPI00295C3215|nr:glucose-6-phosphate exchanger SLC37A2-like isoform X2 [Ruditapes philippinarum]
MARSVPLGIRLLPALPGVDRNVAYKFFILVFTFFCYMSYHLSRKPISIVKSVLHRKNCSIPLLPTEVAKFDNSTDCDWAPFNHGDFATLLGSLDLAYLFAYAVGMFFSGHIAERMNLRHFLSLGMITSGILTAAFGMGYFLGIHMLWYYILVQIIGGLVQSSGWPSVVACVGNWYGKGKRGLIMGIWNSHTSVGNILGSLIAGVWVNHAWGWSFIVPGIIIGCLGILVFFFLVPEPGAVNCDRPVHHIAGEEEEPLMRTGDDDIDHKKDEAISLFKALMIPGVIEFSLCLFFAKLVSYTFLFWLPKYISYKTSYDAEVAGDLSTLFDVGGIVGGITAGLISDFTRGRASTCCVMLLLAAPMMFLYNEYGSINYAHSVGLLLICGFFVNGPYALITTAVSADLGTHKSLKGNSRALASVTAIIDGTGSIGAAIGPLLTGVISPTGWNNVFWMLIAADGLAMVFLIRLVTKEIQLWRLTGCTRQIDDVSVNVNIQNTL